MKTLKIIGLSTFYALCMTAIILNICDKNPVWWINSYFLFWMFVALPLWIKLLSKKATE